MLIITHTLMNVFQMLIRHLESKCVDSHRKYPPLRKAVELQFYLICIFLYVCYLVIRFFFFFLLKISCLKHPEAMLAAVTLVVHHHSIIVL